MDDEGADVFGGPDEGVCALGSGFHFFVLAMEGGGGFEVHGLAGGVALGTDLGKQAFAAGAEVGEDAVGLGAVGVGGDGHFAGSEAATHFAVDAAGVVWVDFEIFVAATNFEEVADGFPYALGGGAGGERSEAFAEGAMTHLVADVNARVVVGEGDAEEVGAVQAEAFAGFGFAEEGVGGAVEKEDGLELRTGEGPFDGANAVAEIEALGKDGAAFGVDGLGGEKEAAEATAEVGGTHEVGLVSFAFATEGEDAGAGGDGTEDGFGFFGGEGDAMGEPEVLGHDWILVGRVAECP